MSEIDVTQSLKDTENSLRDFISTVLEKEIGTDWYDKCGVSAKKVQQWRHYRETEQKQQSSGVVEPRLIYYADFADLLRILESNWRYFSDAFGDQNTMTLYLRELKKLRDPDAHRRELLPHQKHLALGIGGEIRTRIIRFRSKLETTDDCFPRIESAKDSLGNVWIAGGQSWVFPKQFLRPDEVVDYVVTASDPTGAALSYRFAINEFERSEWQSEHVFSVRIRPEHIGKHFSVALQIKSAREYHARAGAYDDAATFAYIVLPQKSAGQPS